MIFLDRSPRNIPSPTPDLAVTVQPPKLRKTTLRPPAHHIIAAALALSSSSAFAQQAPGTIDGPPPTVTAPPPITGVAPSERTPWFPGTTTGLDKVGEDGLFPKTVKAIPCGAAARGTGGPPLASAFPMNAREREEPDNAAYDYGYIRRLKGQPLCPR